MRDFRDVLVSAYYSFGFTHREPINRISRNKFNQLPETSETYLYLQYNLFAENTPEFIQKISAFLELDTSKQDIEFLARKVQPIQNKETMTHKRLGKTRQYLEKLQPHTVEKLNNLLSEVLLDWDFKL